MYSKWQLAKKFLSYYWTSSNGKGHGMHSPFIFHFITRVLNDKTNYPDYERVELLRSQLKNDQSVLTIQDMGAGSSLTNWPFSRRESNLGQPTCENKCGTSRICGTLLSVGRTFGSDAAA
jgi:hypothetical protein